MSFKQIHDRLKDLYLNRRAELSELIEPDPVPTSAVPNLVSQFPGFLEWLKTMDTAARPHIESELKAHRDHALKHEVEKYKKRKRVYEARLENALGRIVGSEVGIAVIREIRRSGKTGTFYPYIVEDQINAGVSSDNTKLATERGMPIYDGDYKIVGSGKGKGSNVSIHYSADLFGVFNNAPRHIEPPRGPASEADEVLLHELVHACRQMNGHRHRMPVTGGYDNEEEYLAVVIANIYLSNKTKTVFRKNHETHDMLLDPEHFLDSTAADLRPRVLLERLRLHQPAFYSDLATIPKAKTPFNPVRWYEHERHQKNAA